MRSRILTQLSAFTNHTHKQDANSKLASFLQGFLFGTVFTDLSTSVDRSS